MIPPRRLDWLDWTAPALGTLLFAGMGWAWGRTVNGGRKLRPFQRALLFYAVLFIFGMAYIICTTPLFAWSDAVMFVLIAAWGVALASVALFRHRRTRPAKP
jgi:hypothetical protein